MADTGVTVVARSHTRHLTIETRQHDVLGIDLGEGPARKPLVFGIIVMALWVALMLAIFRLPTQNTLIFYVVPPVILAWKGSQWSEYNPRRRVFTMWALAARQQLLGHRPLISLGGRQAYRNERTPWSERRNSMPLLERMNIRTQRADWERAADSIRDLEALGKPIAVRARARLYGNNDTAVRLETKAPRAQRKAKS